VRLLGHIEHVSPLAHLFVGRGVVAGYLAIDARSCARGFRKLSHSAAETTW